MGWGQFGYTTCSMLLRPLLYVAARYLRNSGPVSWEVSVGETRVGSGHYWAYHTVVAGLSYTNLAYLTRSPVRTLSHLSLAIRLLHLFDVGAWYACDYWHSAQKASVPWYLLGTGARCALSCHTICAELTASDKEYSNHLGEFDRPQAGITLMLWCLILFTLICPNKLTTGWFGGLCSVTNHFDWVLME